MGSLNHALRISCNRQQNTPVSEFLFEKYQNKSLGKDYPRFVRQIHWIEYHLAPSSKASQMHQLQHAQQTCFNKRKLRKLICIKLTFILFEKVPKPIELLLWVRGQSLDQQLPDRRSKIFAVTLSQIISSFCLAVGFWEVQSIKSQNLQITDCVRNQYFQNCCSSTQNIFIRNVFNLDAILALSYRLLAVAILLFHIWNYKLTLKFRTKIKE